MALILTAILVPPAAPTKTPLKPDGTLEVQTDVQVSITKIKLLIIPQGVAEPADPPSNAREVNVTANPVVVSDMAGARATTDNTGYANKVKVWTFDGSGPVDSDVRNILCTMTSPTTTVSVSAKCCLWFAWAPTGSAALKDPENEGLVDAHRPIGVPVPPGSTSVTITAAASGTPDRRWRHDPAAGAASGPNGLNGSDGTPVNIKGLEVGGYQHANYGSDSITPLTTHLNKLVAMVEDNWGPTPQQPTPVGASATIALTANSTRVFLGMHDGRQWSNNSGDIVVTLTWTGTVIDPTIVDKSRYDRATG